MLIKQFDIWIADLNPQIGADAGKIRPVLIVQTDLMNKIPHPSTLVCPMTTNVKKGSEILRVNLKKGTGNLNRSFDVMIDQMRVIDNNRLKKRMGVLPDDSVELVKENIQIVLNLI